MRIDFARIDLMGVDPNRSYYRTGVYSLVLVHSQLSIHACHGHNALELKIYRLTYSHKIFTRIKMSLYGITFFHREFCFHAIAILQAYI